MLRVTIMTHLEFEAYQFLFSKFSALGGPERGVVLIYDAVVSLAPPNNGRKARGINTVGVT